MVIVILNRSTLEEAMARHNLTRKELAYAVALSRSYFSRIMCGKEGPSAAVRQRLQTIFPEYTFDDLFKIKTEADKSKKENPD
jgi:transcriptional regulator with XRE-family HTH domain